MNKQGRMYAIREIISTVGVRNQEELRRHLGRRGYRVTQATLSRDMRDLGVGKVSSGGGIRYVLPAEAEALTLRPIVGAEVVSIMANESVIVIKTLPGCASTVGEFIDVKPHPDIIGTVAGDNTVLVVPSSTRKTTEVLGYLKHTLIEGR
jgi:transcriptional regulator of arginine metabolism